MLKHRNLNLFLVIIVLFLFFSCAPKKGSVKINEQDSNKELKVWKIPNVDNGAEFYFSPDGKSMIGNAKFNDDTTHLVYTFNIDGTNIKNINATGQDACSYYFPDGKKLIWTSTRDNLELPKGDWSDARNYPTGAELYTSDLDGGNVVRLTNNKYYDAEVSVSPDSKKILFTRSIDGYT